MQGLKFLTDEVSWGMKKGEKYMAQKVTVDRLRTLPNVDIFDVEHAPPWQELWLRLKKKERFQITAKMCNYCNMPRVIGSILSLRPERAAVCSGSDGPILARARIEDVFVDEQSSTALSKQRGLVGGNWDEGCYVIDLAFSRRPIRTGVFILVNSPYSFFG
jgi:hypothetical protein